MASTAQTCDYSTRATLSIDSRSGTDVGGVTSYSRSISAESKLTMRLVRRAVLCGGRTDQLHGSGELFPLERNGEDLLAGEEPGENEQWDDHHEHDSEKDECRPRGEGGRP